MRLNKVSSIIERGISGDELASQFIFGGKLPTKFNPEKTYKRGDMVYVVDNGVVTIYQCLKGGDYEEVEESPEWTKPVIGEMTDGNSPIFKNFIVISDTEPEGYLIWIQPSDRRQINPDILL